MARKLAAAKSAYSIIHGGKTAAANRAPKAAACRRARALALVNKMIAELEAKIAAGGTKVRQRFTVIPGGLA
jgi:hypothetical protein